MRDAGDDENYQGCDEINRWTDMLRAAARLLSRLNSWLGWLIYLDRCFDGGSLNHSAAYFIPTSITSLRRFGSQETRNNRILVVAGRTKWQWPSSNLCTISANFSTRAFELPERYIPLYVVSFALLSAAWFTSTNLDLTSLIGCLLVLYYFP